MPSVVCTASLLRTSGSPLRSTVSVFCVIVTLLSVLVSVLNAKLFAFLVLNTWPPLPTLLDVIVSVTCISVPLLVSAIPPADVIVLNCSSVPLSCFNTCCPLPKLIAVCILKFIELGPITFQVPVSPK